MVGVIGKKIGMTQIFDSDGNILPVTLVKVEPNVVVSKKTKENDGYEAIVIGVDELNAKKSNKPYSGQFKGDVTPKKTLKEMRADDVSSYQVGDEISFDIFENVKHIDVTGQSKGKGFAGVMKRHGFGGGPASHGSKFKRQNGSTGQCAYPSKGFKGVKRAGRMGNDQVTVQNLELVEADALRKILMIKGALPGTKDTQLFIRKACKK